MDRCRPRLLYEEIIFICAAREDEVEAVRDAPVQTEGQDAVAVTFG